MTPTIVALLAFAAMLVGRWLGSVVRDRLPEHHLSQVSREALRFGMTLIASLTALVLGLVIASAQGAFVEQDQSLRRGAADVLLLDRLLAEYGPDAQACRGELRALVQEQVDRLHGEGWQPVSAGAVESLDGCLRRLSPADDGQRALYARMLDLSETMQEARWVRLESVGHRIPVAFLVIVAFWLMVLFWSFGLFSPSNPTVIAVHAVAALSAASAIFLILELEHPWRGLVRVSIEPLVSTLAQLGQ